MGIKLPNSYEKKTSGLITDNELKFEPHIKSMCKKATWKQMQPQKFPRDVAA